MAIRKYLKENCEKKEILPILKPQNFHLALRIACRCMKLANKTIKIINVISIRCHFGVEKLHDKYDSFKIYLFVWAVIYGYGMKSQ
jgi:hypothetical protein